MKKELFIVLLFSVLITSCQCDYTREDVSCPQKVLEIKKSNASVFNFGMPFTEVDELNRIAEDTENVIHYRAARYLAMVELLAGANQALSIDYLSGWTITPYPKVVYNYDNTPKYYEFGCVGSRGEVVSTVVTYAQKEVDGVIAYLFSYPLSYSYSDYDYYVGKRYPERYYGHESPEWYYDDNVEDLVPIDYELHDTGTDEYAQQIMYSQMPAEDIAEMENDLLEEGNNKSEEYLQDYTEYWAEVDNFFSTFGEAIDTINYESIGLFNFLDYIGGCYDTPNSNDAYYVSLLANALDYTTGYFDTYVLADYDDAQLQVTYWDGYCGPAACSWVYRGKYDSYNGNFLPIFGNGHKDYFMYDYGGLYAYYSIGSVDVTGLNKESARNVYKGRSEEADYGLCGCFYEESVPLWYDGEWTFPLYHGGLNRGFNTATNGKYKVKFICEPYDWIRTKKEPVIIAVDCHHYIVAFGTGVTHKKNGKVKDRYFSIVDNGAFTGDHGSHPYMRRHNRWNLHYGLKLK